MTAGKISHEDYMKERRRLERAVTKARAFSREPCVLAEKIDRLRALKAAEEKLRLHKLNYYQLVEWNRCFAAVQLT